MIVAKALATGLKNRFNRRGSGTLTLMKILATKHRSKNCGIQRTTLLAKKVAVIPPLRKGHSRIRGNAKDDQTRLAIVKIPPRRDK